MASGINTNAQKKRLMRNNCFRVSSLPTSIVANRVIVLVSILLAVLSVYGQQQQLRWYDVSYYAPIVKQCNIALTDDRLFVYVNTGDRDINFWLGEPERTGVMLILYGDDAMEFRQALFTEFIEESLNALPANATVQMHTKPNARQAEVQYAREREENHVVSRPRGDDRNATVSGIMEQTGSVQSSKAALKRNSLTETTAVMTALWRSFCCS